MNPDEEQRFKALRYRFYRLGKHNLSLLQEMGILEENPEMDRPNKDDLRALLFEIHNQGRIGELEERINKKEKEILEQVGHVGDPCIYCNLPHDEVKPGPCPARKGGV